MYCLQPSVLPFQFFSQTPQYASSTRIINISDVLNLFCAQTAARYALVSEGQECRHRSPKVAASPVARAAPIHPIICAARSHRPRPLPSSWRVVCPRPCPVPLLITRRAPCAAPCTAPDPAPLVTRRAPRAGRLRCTAPPE